nr:MAG TPA: hypothetical protein [Bacteriophage sp.]
MDNKLEIFSECTNKQLLKIYKDVIDSKQMGIKAISLNQYAEKLKRICAFEAKAQAIDFAEKLFYEETAKRFFDQMK